MNSISKRVLSILYYLSTIIVLAWFLLGIISGFTGYSFFGTVYGLETILIFWFINAFLFTFAIPIVPIILIVLVIDLFIKIKSKNKFKQNVKFYDSIIVNILTLIIILFVILCYLIYGIQF